MDSGSSIFIFLFLCHGFAVTNSQDAVNFEPPCPLEWNSAPCVCSGHSKAPELDCSLAERPEQFFSVFTSLRDGLAFVSFTLQHSNLTSLPGSPFVKSNFTKFIINDVEISSIPDNFFESSKNTVIHITVSKTLITQFPYESIQGYPKLQYLILENNLISNIPSNAFGDKGLPELQELNLKGNRITTIGSYAFSNLPFLFQLDLSENNLTVLESHAFSVRNHKESLILSLNKNSIHKIATDAFEGLTFSSIHLEFNHLENLEQSTFEPFLEVMERTDSSVYVRGNPISCNTSLTWLVEKSLPIKQHIRDLVCPDGKMLDDLTKDDLIKQEKISKQT